MVECTYRNHLGSYFGEEREDFNLFTTLLYSSNLFLHEVLAFYIPLLIYSFHLYFQIHFLCCICSELPLWFCILYLVCLLLFKFISLARGLLFLLIFVSKIPLLILLTCCFPPYFIYFCSSIISFPVPEVCSGGLSNFLYNLYDKMPRF